MQTLRRFSQALVGIGFWACFALLWWLLFEQGKLATRALVANGEVVAAIASFRRSRSRGGP